MSGIDFNNTSPERIENIYRKNEFDLKNLSCYNLDVRINGVGRMPSPLFQVEA